MSVGQVCNREVVVIQKNGTVTEAARLMRRYHVGTLVVVETRANVRVPVGMLTDRDIVIEVIAEEVPVERLLVGDVMSDQLATAREEDGIWDTIKRMRSKGIRRMPVVSRDGALQGLVTVDDLLSLLSEELRDLAQLTMKQAAREQKVRASGG